MSDNSNANWWNFSIDNDERAEKILPTKSGEVEVNPELPGGHLGLTYHNYLGLDRLLQCQIPSSKTPDERIFIITHQLFELAFKELIFDLAVISQTFAKLLAIPDKPEFQKLAIGNDRDFWLPALTASARIKFTCRELMPMIMRYLLNVGEEETFSGVEFYKFRDNLTPASGFQAAQFRLIQRAFGKSNLLSVHLFPSQTFKKTYGEESDGTELTTVVDKLIVQEDIDISSPPGDSELAEIAEFDNLIHKLLGRLPSLAEGALAPISIPKLHDALIAQVTENFQKILKHQRNVAESPELLEREQRAISQFDNDIKAAAAKENERRAGLVTAREGAFYLHAVAPDCNLTKVLNRLLSADETLHGSHEESFLALHLKVARENLKEVQEHAQEMGDPEPPIGTGGGGLPYLGFMMRNLLPLFPAFIAYRDLEDSPVLSWIE
jgi:tryptophan 2,3-dioxygenase